MKEKKIIKRKLKNKVEKLEVRKMSTSDLYAMYMFVIGDTNNKGFGITTPETKSILRTKQKEIEEEMYMRTYGFNPFTPKDVKTIMGIKPENIDLDKVAIIVSGEVEELADEDPKRFVVAKGPLKEEK